MLVNTVPNTHSAQVLTHTARTFQSSADNNVANKSPGDSNSVNISSAGHQALSAATQAVSTFESNPASTHHSPVSTNYQQQMPEIIAGVNLLRANALSDPSSPEVAKLAYDMAHANLTDGQGVGGLIDISGTIPGGSVRYTSGEPVTEESKAYFTQYATSYQNTATKLYNSEVAKGTTAGDIVNQLFDLQAQQPARFRTMMMWPPSN